MARIVKSRAFAGGGAGKTIAGVGIGSPGPLDTARGVVLLTPNLGWTNFPLRDRVTDALGLPATLDNDANCAIFGEWWRGAARGAEHVVGLTIGTGIGGGIVLHGEIYHGASDIAGEIGHMTIDSTGRRCKCGNYGCLEAYASGPAIAARAVEGRSRRRDVLPDYVRGDLTQITAQVIYEAAHGRRRYARESSTRPPRCSVRRRNIINILNPQVVVICGGRDACGRSAVRAVAKRGKATRLQARGKRLPHRAGRAHGHGRRLWCRGGVHAPEVGTPVKRLGVVGSMVWDTIYDRDPAQRAVEEWGGISYSLAALDATLGPEWEIVPLVKVGRDLAGRANEFLRSLQRVAPGARFVEVPEPNNRVTLRYAESERRCEQMSGGVPAWTWPELGPMVRDLDALYVNFISGYEMDLTTAQLLRHGFRGLLYADLHSLFLGKSPDGTRVPQALPNAPAWFGCFDVVQLNEDEMRHLGRIRCGCSRGAGEGCHTLLVTLGRMARPTSPAAIRTRGFPPPSTRSGDGDPTGCGDVSAHRARRILAGADLEDAVRLGAEWGRTYYRAATGLRDHLMGRLTTV